MKKLFLILAVAVALASCVTNQNTLLYLEPTESEIYGKSDENGWVHVKNVPAKRYFILLGGYGLFLNVDSPLRHRNFFKSEN